MNNFEGTWESTWLSADPNYSPGRDTRIGMGIDSLLRLGQRGNFIYYSGKGNQPLSYTDGVPFLKPQWNTYARTDLEERVLIGRFWGPMWKSFTHEGPPNLELAQPDHAEYFLQQSGQFFFELSTDGKTFTGGYNASSQPTHWFAWDGRKISHNPRYRKSINPPPFPARDLLTVVVTPPSGLF
jgi:hypothetical protein